MTSSDQREGRIGKAAESTTALELKSSETGADPIIAGEPIRVTAWA